MHLPFCVFDPEVIAPWEKRPHELLSLLDIDRLSSVELFLVRPQTSGH